MQPQNVPEGPPPFVPSPGQPNPYDFLQPQGPQKKSLLPRSTSQKQRLLIVVAGAVILLILVAVVFGVISSLGGGPKDTYLSLEQQQAELIRVSDLGSKSAKEPEAKALAITVKYSILSQQAQVQKLAKSAHAPTDAKSIALGKNSKTDAALTTAEQSNQFDKTFLSIMKTSLTTYRKTLAEARIGTKGTKSQATLKSYEDQINVLIAEK
jgi:hypothetical protein